MKRTSITSRRLNKKTCTDKQQVSICDALPRETMGEILAYLPVPDLLSTAITCKLMMSYCRNLVVDKLDVSHLTLAKPIPKLLQQIKNKELIAHQGQFRQFNLKETEKLAVVNPSCHILRASLRFPDNYYPDATAIKTFKPLHTPNLKELEIGQYDPGWIIASFRNVKGLESLKLSSYDWPCDAWAVNVSEILENSRSTLKHLTWKPQSQHHVLHRFLEECKQLETLKIRYTSLMSKMQDDHYKLIPMLQDMKLKHLSLKSCWVSKLSNQVVNFLPSTLEKLELSLKHQHFLEFNLASKIKLPDAREIKLWLGYPRYDMKTLEEMNSHFKSCSPNLKTVQYLYTQKDAVKFSF